ncbi:MAG TPA: DUF2148 domain-containing protein [Anaerolineales bacterium]
MDQREIFQHALHQVAELCAVAAMTAPKSGGQLFLKGSKPFMETVIVDDRDVLHQLAEWMRVRGDRIKAPLWVRDADTAEKLDLVLFIGLSKWYPPLYDCGACGYATCAEFLRAAPGYQRSEGSEDWEFAGPVCQLRAVDLGIAVGSAAKTAAMHNIDARCQTRLAGAARRNGVIQSDLAVALSMSITHKNIFFDKPPMEKV